jgi:hypothetical protein
MQMLSRDQSEALEIFVFLLSNEKLLVLHFVANKRVVSIKKFHFGCSLIGLKLWIAF